MGAKVPEPLLRYQIALLSAQQESSIDGIMTLDAGARVVSYNGRFADLWGLPHGLSAARLPESTEEIVDVMVGKVRDPAAFLDAMHDFRRNRWKRGHEQLQLSDGRTLERYTAPVFGPRGRYYGRIWTFRDVTDRRLDHERCRASETRYRQLFEAGGDPVLVVDGQTRRVEDANPAALEVLGYGLAELLSLRVETLDVQRAEAFQALRKFARLRRWPRNATRLLRRKDGTTFPAEINAACFEQGGGTKLLATLRDLTYRRRTAQVEFLRERESAQRQFVATVSHELRTPIAAIRGFAETLLTGGLEDAEARREFVKTIFKHSVRVTQLVDDLLTLSLLDSGKQRARFEDVEARRFVRDFVAGMEPVARRKRHMLRADVCPDLVVRADLSQLTQVLQNLVDNALKFSPAGTAVRIEADARDGQGHFRVKDSGPGIAPADAGKIFEPFQRAERARKIQGAGLGLTIARQIVLAHGGRIWVESREGAGCTFHFTLPASRPAEALAPEPTIAAS